MDLTECDTPERLDDFCRRVAARVDATRREKAACIRGRHERALSLGAGLLLQWAVAGAQKCGCEEARPSGKMRQQTEDGREKLHTGELLLRPTIFTAAELLEKLESFAPEPSEISYRFGKYGKPEFADLPLHFSISHSGDYVLCAVSDAPIGADIQQIRQNVDARKLASRFFPKQERDEVFGIADETARRERFFHLWTRREAYAKLTGEGLPMVIDRSLPDNLRWTGLAAPQGYAAGICSM